MGSYDFDSRKVHFYSRNLWSSHQRALKAIFAWLSLAPVCDQSTMDNRKGFSPSQEEAFLSERCHSPVQSSSPMHRFCLDVWRHPSSPWSKPMGPVLLPKRVGTTNPSQCQEPLVQTFWEPFCTDYGHLKDKGAGPVISATGRSEGTQQS